MSTAYNLSPITLSPSTPEWAKIVIPNMQNQRDVEYKTALDHYYGQVQIWIDDNTFKRGNAPDPAKYVPTKFEEKPPAREVVNWSSDGFVANQVVDPNVVPPVLPLFVSPAPNTGFTTDAPANSAANLSFQATVVTRLMQIQSDLALIKSKLGI
jgi:hypothetical protein